MPAVTCLGCNRQTNTAMCNWIDCEKNKGLSTPQFTNECYLAYVDGKWVEGCAYKKLGPKHRQVYAKYLDGV